SSRRLPRRLNTVRSTAPAWSDNPAPPMLLTAAHSRQQAAPTSFASYSAPPLDAIRTELDDILVRRNSQLCASRRSHPRTPAPPLRPPPPPPRWPSPPSPTAPPRSS